MAVATRRFHHHPRPPRHIVQFVATLVFISLALLLLLYKLDDAASRTKTVAGHNLEPTPWHLFPPKKFSGESRRAIAVKILRCSPYLSCGTPAIRRRSRSDDLTPNPKPKPQPQCPEFFRWIHRDLEPWSREGISAAAVERAREFAAFRAVIVGGKLFVEMYYDCVQSRLAFTIWGLVQLLRRYPAMVPDVDMMFDCMDKPRFNRTDHHSSVPPPLFRYCTTADHYDIPFPDWSFWGWPETNINPWDEEFRDIKHGSEKKSWKKKLARAYWKGNPHVGSPVRTKLLQCNNSHIWGAQIFHQDWAKEASGGYEKSKLSDQCNTRYKIYAEGYAWSVSLKYILSCGSLALIISPEYEDFFSRGLVPMENYWPISLTHICPSIKYAVDWGIAHVSEAERIGKAGQELMENLSMNRVYDYMFHLITEYSKLQRFKPVPPSSSQEVCSESLLCHADSVQRRFFEKSTAHPSPDPPCSLHSADGDIINIEIQRRKAIINNLENMKPHIHTSNSKHF